MSAPRIRTDIVDLYVFRHTGDTLDLLQLRRAHPPMQGTWQPVMGHIEPGETAPETARREALEELNLTIPDDALLPLEQVHPFYLPEQNAIILSPRFATRVDLAWTPTLNNEHTAWRWVNATNAQTEFMWPGQWAAIKELTSRYGPT